MPETPQPAAVENPGIVERAVRAMPDDLPWRVIDGMTDFRSKAGMPMALKLAVTPPEERTWLEGAVSTVISFTDFGDGKGARFLKRLGIPRPGSHEEGRDGDRDADRKYAFPHYFVLAANGEIPPEYLFLKAGRELSMEGMRSWGAKHGKDLKSKESSRQKTVFDMALFNTAHSPLATHKDLLRWEASMAGALSIEGWLETLFDYMKKDDNDAPATAQNSRAREVSAGPLTKLSEFIDDRFPGVTPSHVTRWSKRLAIGSIGLGMARPDKPLLATIGSIISDVGDAVDGNLARTKGVDSEDGMIEDVEADLQMQITRFAGLSEIARRRGNRVAAINYALAAMTTSLSALTRAEAESQGYIVAEGGIGTRAGRAVLGNVGLAFNRHQNVSDIVSAMIVSGNVNTVRERTDVVRKGEESEYCVGTNDDPEFKRLASRRKEAILPQAKRGLAAGMGLLAVNGVGIAQDWSAETPGSAATSETEASGVAA